MGVVGCGVPGIPLGLCTLAAAAGVHARIPAGERAPRSTRLAMGWGVAKGAAGLIGGVVVMWLGLSLL